MHCVTRTTSTHIVGIRAVIFVVGTRPGLAILFGVRILQNDQVTGYTASRTRLVLTSSGSELGYPCAAPLPISQSSSMPESLRLDTRRYAHGWRSPHLNRTPCRFGSSWPLRCRNPCE